MRGLAALLVVALATSAVSAAPRAPTGSRPDVVRLEARLRSARIQRNLGWALSAVGAVLAATGTITAVYGAYQDGYNVAGLIAGVSLAAAGVAFAIPGMVLSLRGQDEMIEAEWRLRAALAPGPAPPSPAASVGGSSSGALGMAFVVRAAFSF